MGLGRNISEAYYLMSGGLEHGVERNRDIKRSNHQLAAAVIWSVFGPNNRVITERATMIYISLKNAAVSSVGSKKAL